MLLLCLALTLAFLLVLCKLWLVQRSLSDIAKQLEARLTADSNNPIFLSVRDRHVRQLAAVLNDQLRTLRRQRHRYETGDRELKEAVTNISHDLRTPLTAICGYLDLLEAGTPQPPQDRYLAAIRNRTEALKQLTEELFHYSVILSTQETMVLEEVCLNSALEESLASFYAALTQAGITPCVQLPERRILRQLNREALSRVFSNVLSNALKYSGGDLRVTLEESGTVSFSNAAPGLTEVQVGKLFDRFFTVEAARRSSGLGLSITKTLVEHMGGQVAAEYMAETLTIRLLFPQNASPSP